MYKLEEKRPDLFRSDEPSYQRITSIDQLHKGDEIVFLRKPSQRRPGYCIYTGDIGPDSPPQKLRRGVVLATTANNGVLVFVTQGPKGMKRRKHWVPLARVYLKTGSNFAVLNPNDLEWAEADKRWQEVQGRMLGGDAA